MGDIAQILGTVQANTASENPLAKMLSPSQQDRHNLPTIVPTMTNSDAVVKVGTRSISSSKPARKWSWAQFASSARTDGAMFSHWVRAGVEYTDYPYAKFDIHLDPITYTTQEYTRFLSSNSWTKSETDQLVEMCRKYELRWPVIYDRWVDHYMLEDGVQTRSNRSIEDLQHRYYSTAALLAQSRISEEAAAEVQALVKVTSSLSPDTPPDRAERILMETAAARSMASANPEQQPLVKSTGTGSSNKAFDVERERKRRNHMELLWRRNKQEEYEELDLRAELRLIDAQLRKLKKNGGHVIAASKSSQSAYSSQIVSLKPGSNIVEDNTVFLDGCFTSTAPTPMPGTPYLQSGRLIPPATGGSLGLNKALLLRMDSLLADLKIPKQPIPTKRVCDMYDSVRKDTLKLLTMQKMVLQKEGMLQARRSKLAKLTGAGGVTEEEALLGIAPKPPATVAHSTASASANVGGRAKAARSAKPKPAGVATKGGKVPVKKATDSVDGVDAAAATKKKAAPKRKRKSTDAKPTVATPTTVPKPVAAVNVTPVVAAAAVVGATASSPSIVRTQAMAAAPTSLPASVPSQSTPSAAPASAAATPNAAGGGKGSAKKRVRKS